MRAKTIKKLRKKISSKCYIENRIISLSEKIDDLKYDIEFCHYGNRYVKRGEIEKENKKFINDKKIRKLERRIEYYKNKLK